MDTEVPWVYIFVVFGLKANGLLFCGTVWRKGKQTFIEEPLSARGFMMTAYVCASNAGREARHRACLSRAVVLSKNLCRAGR